METKPGHRMINLELVASRLRRTIAIVSKEIPFGIIQANNFLRHTYRSLGFEERPKVQRTRFKHFKVENRFQMFCEVWFN